MGSQTYVTPGAGTFNWPTNVTQATVEVWGAGGGGAGGGTDPGGGGGAGGGYARAVIARVGASVSVQVGTAGVGGSDPAGAGGTGGDSWWGSAATLMAKGGPGAPGGSTTTAATAVGGHVGPGGFVSFNGGNGGAGTTSTSQARGGGGGGGSGGSASIGNNGGSANGGGAGATAVTGGGPGGAGGAGTTAATGGTNGSTPASGNGGGGGGGGNETGAGGTGSGGGAGADGRVLVTWSDVPTITDVEGIEAFMSGQANVTVAGTNYEAAQGTGKVELGSTSDYATATKVVQTVTSWAASSIDITGVLGALTPGPLYLFVTNNGQSFSVGMPVTVTAPPPGASWLAALNTAISVDVTSGNVQLRLRVGVTNSGAAGATAYKWRYEKNNSGTLVDITSSSTNVRTFATSHYVDGDDVPQLITGGSYQSDNNAAEESTGAFTLSAGLAGSTSVESEIALEVIAADLNHTDTLEFFITQGDNTVLDTYTQVPSMTIQKGGAAPGLVQKSRRIRFDPIRRSRAQLR